MKNLGLLCAMVLVLPTFSCKQNAPEPTNASEVPIVEPANATVTVTEPATIPRDSNMVIGRLEESHARVKGTSTIKHRKQGSKMVKVESDPVIAHYEEEVVAVTTKPAKPVTTKTPEAELVPDAAGYYYQSPYRATFPGGEAALDKFLDENIRYPERAMSAGTEGTVYVEFYVDEKGNVVQALFPGKKLGNGLEEEVVRVIKLMPKWNPGSYKNAFVKSRFVVPITFELK